MFNQFHGLGCQDTVPSFSFVQDDVSIIPFRFPDFIDAQARPLWRIRAVCPEQGVKTADVLDMNFIDRILIDKYFNDQHLISFTDKGNESYFIFPVHP